MSKFYPPSPPLLTDTQAQRIARLETLVAAMEAALRDSNALLFDLWCVTEGKESRERVMARRDENIELYGTAAFYMREGSAL